MRRFALPGIFALAFALMIAAGGCATHPCTDSDCAADAQITAAVQAQLKQYPDLGGANQIYVSTHHRVVYLTGQVTTDLQRDKAQAAAEQIPGVAQVVNTIALSYSGL
ncbi:MAG TPA: BON domain-containing protein [Steroidobacteraceae bacterium]|nr:BON domain-containing protein [Steroidobacteraceae bacterium]